MSFWRKTLRKLRLGEDHKAQQSQSTRVTAGGSTILAQRPLNQRPSNGILTSDWGNLDVSVGSLPYDRRGKVLEYKTLDEAKSEIRLLKFESSDDERSPIRCTLRHVSCHKTWPQYTAVSYVWGDPKDTICITVNDCFVHVTRNLEAALRELRNRDFDTLWIDALCINQHDKNERGHQVHRMKDIYTKAADTVAWLGSDDSGRAGMAFRCMKLLETREPEVEFVELVGHLDKLPETDRQKPDQVKAIRAMIRRPYWSRTWIIQELVLSRHIMFLWGTNSMELSTFKAGLESLVEYTPQSTSFDGWREIKGIMGVIVSFEANKKDPYTHDIGLQYALSQTSKSQATDPRDKIFSIMGLCSDGAALVPSPDYYQTLDTILRELMIRQLSQPLSDHGYLPMDLICLDNPATSKRSGFPSWVIDWKTIWESKGARTICQTKYRGLECGYSACGGSKHEVKVWGDGRVLIARGYVFDKIRQLSSGLLEENVSPSLRHDAEPFHNNPYLTLSATYEAVWRTLVLDCHRYVSSARAPAEFGRCFSKVYSNHAEPFLLMRGPNVRASLEIARDFPLHGRTFYEWAQTGVDLLLIEDVQNNLSNDGITQEQPEYGSDDKTKRYLDRFVDTIMFGTMHSRLMTTERGYIGLAHNQSQVGDSICLLQGCTVPMILRPCEGGYTVVGESYVHGIMEGQFWDAQDKNTMQYFHLI
ncbi:Heterokaryon incompatibility protein [Hyphodiscus hymeniophilus]|uniref:Heterokaryon incompatibility protein n=1 Tax=Hyphodiscus hymeniophilus TaxID=353542 RepID=A0A9P6SML9_9HELO|nr:Heterokaryon incompatibility protein [Hyphodiscus hymeniophilus]